jgi:hypothetical protein
VTAAFDGRFDGIGKEDKTHLIYSSNNISSKQKTKKEEQKSLIIQYGLALSVLQMNIHHHYWL